MKRLLLILAIAVTMTALTGTKAHAAPAVQDPLDNIELPSVLQKTFAGYYHFIEPSTGDTLAMIVFNARAFPQQGRGKVLLEDRPRHQEDVALCQTHQLDAARDL